MRINLFKLFFLAVFFILVNFIPALALEQEDQNEIYSIRLDQETIQKGYTVSAFDSAIKFSLVPGILSSSTPVEVIKLNETIPEQDDLSRISPVYQFEFKNKAAYFEEKPFYIQLNYNNPSNNQKQVFFYDKNFNAWRPLPTQDYPLENSVRSLIHLPFARIAVFENPKILTVGQASWYKFKKGNFAASPDFPDYTILRVFNLANNKFVDVVVNDYGPDRVIFPGRVIDLDKIAFAKIADLADGMINIKIEALFIPEKISVL